MAVITHVSSAGHVLSDGAWLDSHFEACRPEYLALLQRARIPRGGMVLDAGCGTGSYLPYLVEMAGEDGSVIALDIAPEHLRPLQSQNLRPVAADVGHLPFGRASVDAIWSANVSQFFSDEGLAALLHEFRHVLKPGGLLAVKDVDMGGWRVEPAPPFVGMHLAEACAGEGATVQSIGSIRGRRLAHFLDAAGFADVEQHTEVIERSAPLDPASRQFWAEWLVYLADVASRQSLPAADRDFWCSLETDAAAEAYVLQPDFYGCEMQLVATGRAPEAGG